MEKSGGQRGWTKPEAKLLGKLDDVAGAQTPVAQGAGNAKS